MIKPTLLKLAALALPVLFSVNGQTIPADAKATCTVTAPVFSSWFETGTPSLNGVVKPANSLTFPNVPNCSFYQWSKQMFLWLTSPAPATYGGGGGRIFDSKAFFDVLPVNSSGQRVLEPHSAGRIRTVGGIRIAQKGPHGLPVVVDKKGKIFEVEAARVAPSGRPMLRDTTGNLVEIDSVTIPKVGRPVLKDQTGKTVQLLTPPKALALSGTLPILRKIILKGKPVFFDPFGNVIDTEEGQADDGVLVSQGGSLVYYITMVNDVLAYFATQTNQPTPPPGTKFPVNTATENPIIAFAASHSVTFPDPEALAVEVKSSWVEASTLSNPNDYITIQAVIPTFDKSNPAQWKPASQKTVKLALVGMHVVGSTAGHPEMIWATFEHFGNAPNAQFQYINTANATKTMAQSTAGNWVFCASNSGGPFNVQHAQLDTSTGDILPVSPNSISASDTLRSMPWGMPGSSATSNTEVISIHNSVHTKMPAGDIRDNYFMTGATWTIFGAPPSGGNQVGTNKLANTTMETYATGSNCFSCHVTNQVDVSHVFSVLKPLF